MNNQNIGNEGIENNNFGNMNPTQTNNINTGVTFEVPQMQNDGALDQSGMQVSPFQPVQPESQMINNMGTMQTSTFTALQPENQMMNNMESGMQAPAFQPVQPEGQPINNMDTMQASTFTALQPENQMMNNMESETQTPSFQPDTNMANDINSMEQQAPTFTTPQPEMQSMVYNQPQPETITPTFEQPSTQPENYQSEMLDSVQSASNDVNVNPAQNPDEAVSSENLTQQAPQETETVSTETTYDSGDKKTGLGFIIGLFILLLIVIIALPYIGKILT